MTVKQLKEILNAIENENIEVVDHYNDSINGYYFKESDRGEELILSRYNVQPRIMS